MMLKAEVVPLVIFGLGNIGQALVGQIKAQKGLQLIGLADSSGLLFAPKSLSDKVLNAALQAKKEGGSLLELAGCQHPVGLPDGCPKGVILVDATDGVEMRPLWQKALQTGYGVVLANKHPLVGPWSEVKQLFHHPRLRYEATVGAGLPIISTLRYLLDTGDRIIAVEGVLSGTLNHLCARLEQGMAFSKALLEARSLGYTEPDPREDLSGKDVARKALILARTAGWPLEVADLKVEALYPEELSGFTTEEFISSISTLDETYAGRFKEAWLKGQTLRYVARIGPEGGEVGLMAVDQNSPLGTLNGPGNYVAFHTKRYETPLIISGPGAGLEVTAAAILGDIIDLARSSAIENLRRGLSALADRGMRKIFDFFE
jgi:homoserine dehydrogenase